MLAKYGVYICSDVCTVRAITDAVMAIICVD